jgi:hypothetical protein
VTVWVKSTIPPVLTFEVTRGVVSTVLLPSAQYWNQPVQGLSVVSARHAVCARNSADVSVTAVGAAARPSQPASSPAAATTAIPALSRRPSLDPSAPNIVASPEHG